METVEDDAHVRALHERYLQALGQGDMAAVATLFAYPAVLKGFLDDVVVATDAAALQSAYDRLIAAAPKAQRTDLKGTEVSSLRPGVRMLTMTYRQYDASDQLLHEGQAVYFMKPVNGSLKMFAVM